MKKSLILFLLTALMLGLCFSLSACGFLNTLRLPPLEGQGRVTPAPTASVTPAAETPSEAQPAEIEPAEPAAGMESPENPDTDAAGPASAPDESGAQADAQAPAPDEPSADTAPAATAAPAPTPVAAAHLPPKPDVDIHSFEFLLANSYNSIGMEYAPPYGNFEGQGIDQRIIDPAMEFLTAAREAGFNVWVSAALRNSEFLNTWYLSYYNNVYNGDPIETANHFLAQGIDEHQTGLALDFTDQLYRSALYEIFDDPEMADTELYAWLVEHCADYGFILRYPPDKQEYYGVACRHPAHFRYVGKEAARYITDNDLCLEEFLLLYEDNGVILPKP